jgi:hypothetical protein
MELAEIVFWAAAAADHLGGGEAFRHGGSP